MSRKAPLRTAFLTLFIFLLCFSACAYEAKTHGKNTRAAAELIRKTDSLNIYEELYDKGYVRQMVAGSEAGDFGNIDGNSRSFRHNAGALEWARNGAGTADMMNWEGALRAYDYTASARAQAYRRLGYVSHLIADMAQPDYVFNYPHPGSSYRREEGRKIYYGFEALVEKYIDDMDFPGKEVKKPGSLDDYFNGMAKAAKKTYSQARYTLPLGLETQAKILEAKDAPIIPAINDSDPAERKKYLDLAKELLDQAVEYNAGTLELFYDIVNQPPYVMDVTVTQDGKDRYHGWYEEMYDDIREQLAGVEKPANYKRVSARSLRKSASPIEDDKKALIRVTFGPSEDAEERIDPASVKVFAGDIEVPGAMTGPRIWEGVFTYNFESKEPEKIFPIKISARDIHNHFPRAGLPAQGYELDSDPGTPARLSGYKPPYPWKDYEPGADSNHSIVIRQTVPPPIAESIEVFSQDARFVNSRWAVPTEAEARKGKEALLEKDSSGVKDGMDIGKADFATVRISFSQIMDDETLRLKLGAVDLPLSKAGELTYEASIPLEEFNKPGSDQVYRFEITGKGVSGLELDAYPNTVTVFDGKKGRWIAQESGADTTHSLRIYGEIKPMLKGIVHELETASSSGHPLVGKPLAGWNVLMYVGSIEIDKPLCEEVARLARSSRAGKLKEDPQALNLLKDKVKSSCHVLYGTMPGWIVKTDSEGKFTFPLYKYPGRDGVIKAYYAFFAFPPDNVETDDPRSAVFDTLVYDIASGRSHSRDLDYWTRNYVNNGLISNALGGTVNAATPFLEIASGAKRQRLASLLDEYKRSGGKSRRLLEELFGAWQDIYYDTLIAMSLRENRQPPVFSVYEIDGTVSGEEMVPPVKKGYVTEVYLIKQGLDESRTKESVAALSVDTQKRVVTGDLNDPKSHRPPYKFKFTEKIPEHLAINRYVRLSTGGLKVVPVGAGFIFFELSPTGDAKKFADRAIDALWNNFKPGK